MILMILIQSKIKEKMNPQFCINIIQAMIAYVVYQKQYQSNLLIKFLKKYLFLIEVNL
jgi:hypothetical protein